MQKTGLDNLLITDFGGNFALKLLSSGSLVTFVMRFYVTFVARHLWSWFLTGFGVPHISYWRMYGLIMLIDLLFQLRSQGSVPEFGWKIVHIMLDACVPEEKRETVAISLKQLRDDAWMDLISNTSDKLFEITFVLGVGWCIHKLLI